MESWSLSKSEQFCLTLSAGKTPENILEAYGADASEARYLTSAEFFRAYEPTATSAALRVGSFGSSWSFCIEFENCIGFMPGVQRKLSQGAESFLLSRAGNAYAVLDYTVDGEIVESFEPGNGVTRVPSSHDFAGRVERLSESSDGITATLEILAEYTGHHVTTTLLDGPLLSVVVPTPDRNTLMRYDVSRLERVDPSKTPRGLGRRLGSVP
ncbi:DUF6461 domain-containing protein [Streptomyces griseoviridis]|uniref:DUF6461 domain-containing protein n=1 Tax=Streptomyces griseoviridis TaxID=45398 RepID=UPI00340D4776